MPTRVMLAMPRHKKFQAIGAAPNIPREINQRRRPGFSPVLYRGAEPTGLMVNRLRNFRGNLAASGAP